MKKRKWPVWVKALIIMALVGMAWIYWYKKYSATAPGGNSGLRSAVFFELSDAKGAVHNLANFVGQPVVLHFWASWCPTCLDELPEWIGLAEELKGRPLRWIAISLDSNWVDANKILSKAKSAQNVLSLLDSSGRVAEQYGSFQYPETYLLDSKLRIVKRWAGPQNWKDPKLRAFLNALEPL